MATLVYSLKDYENVLFSDTLKEYQLPENTIRLINELNTLLESKQPSTQSTTQTHHNHNVFEKHRHKKRKDTHSDNWLKDKHASPSLSFPPKEKKSEFDECVSSIRSLMNKLSRTNFDINCQKIIDALESYKEDQEKYDKIMSILFEISGNNQFFSEIYSKLHKCLVANISKEELYNEKVAKYIRNYIGSTESIKYVDQEKDYDQFCDYNKKNDIRKSNAIFLMNLAKQELISKPKYVEVIDTLISLVKKKYDISILGGVVEEITENIFLLMNKEYIECLKPLEEFVKVTDELKAIGEYKMREKAGLPTRAIFKYRTMCEYI